MIKHLVNSSYKLTFLYSYKQPTNFYFKLVGTENFVEQFGHLGLSNPLPIFFPKTPPKIAPGIVPAIAPNGPPAIPIFAPAIAPAITPPIPPVEVPLIEIT
ncbi:hypothetical protein [Flavobacterium sp. TSSA_36]|uniref:hypothetical protein n=1 Tax=Flavobacterium sp. TSSA_36 TaxID=3447669 RepID=UPI003F3A7F4F